MKSQFIQLLRYKLPRHRRNPLIKFIRRSAQVTYRLIENDNHDISTNGEQRLLELLAKQGGIRTIFDVGANVGKYVTTAVQAFPQATVYAFEPVQQTYALLNQRHGQTPRVKTLNYGLSDLDQVVNFSVQTDDSTNSTSHPEIHALLKPAGERVFMQCQLRKASSAAEELGVSSIDFLKIDTEGNDWFVLNGFVEWLSRGRIQCIQFEYGTACVSTRRLLLDHYRLLAPYGYKIGKVFPTFIDFKSYHPEDEDFIGPNFFAVHESSSFASILG